MDKNVDKTQNTAEFFDRFFAYDLLDRYPNHRIAAEADYSLRLLWSAEKVCIQDWSFSGERVREILYDALTIEILLNAIGAYKIYCTAPWDLSIIAFAMLTVCKYDPRDNSFVFTAPLIFSIVRNASETSDFFNKLLKFIVDARNYGRSIFIDISRITDLTIDALMYLLAIINNLNTMYRGRYSFEGNSPNDATVKQLFEDSGFFRYVKRKGSSPLQQNKENIQIITGTESNPLVAKNMSEYICKVANIDKKDCRFLYVMMIELMLNTKKHAYDVNETILDPHWYCFAEYDNDDTIAFTFMDTGEGIPATVQKNFPERIDLLKIKGDDKYVISAKERAR